MLKRALAMLLAMVMVVGMLPVGALAADTSSVSDTTEVPDSTDPIAPDDEGVGDWSDWEHIPNGDGETTTINAYYGEEYEYLVIPGTIDGYRVTGIGSGAFVRAVIGTLVMPGSVTTIGSRAFFKASISYVEFDGTEAQYAALRERTESGNDAFLVASYYCARKEAIYMDTPFSVTLEPWVYAEYSFEVPQTGYYMITGSGTDNGNGWYYFPNVNLSFHSDHADGNWLGFFYAEAGEVKDVYVNNYNEVALTSQLTFQKLSVLLPGEAATMEMPANSRYYYEVRFTEEGKYALRSANEQLDPENETVYTQFTNTSSYKGNMEYIRQTVTDGSCYNGYAVEADTVALCSVANNYWEGLQITAEVIAVPEVSGIAFRKEQLEGNLGFTYDVYVDVDPAYGWTELTFSVEDESIARVTGEFENGCSIELMAGGETTLTVTAPNGVSDTMPVFVDAPEELVLGVTSQQTSLPSSKGEYYLFTAPEDGIYYFQWPMTMTEDYGWVYPDLSARIVEGESASLVRDLWAYEENMRYRFYRMAAGTELELYLYNYHYAAEVTACLLADKADKPSEIISDANKIVGLVGYEFSFETSYRPSTAYEEMRWTIADDSVASVGDDGSWISITLLQPGETVLTVYYGELSYEIPVICWEPQDMEVGVTYDKTLAPGEEFIYTFTPGESGKYCFCTPYEEIDGNWYTPSVEISGEDCSHDGTETVNGRYVYYYQLSAGHTYTFTLRNYSDRTMNTGAVVFPEPRVESIKWNRESISGKIGDTVYLNVESWEPAEARLGAIEFEIADTDIAQIWSSGWQDVNVHLEGGGETTLIVKGSGFTAMIPITVESYPPLELDVPANPTLESWQTAHYTFTAPEDGFYRFAIPAIYTENSYFTFSFDINARNSNGWHYVTGNWGGDRWDLYWVEAGTQLQVSVTNQYGVTVTPTLTVSKAAPVEEIYPGNLPLLLGGTTVYTPSVAPDGAWSKLYFSVDDESVVRITNANYSKVTLEGVSVGTATLTITSENGLRAECTVKVFTPTELTLDTPVEVTLGQEESAYFRFTAPEDGVYTFKTPLIDGDAPDMSWADYYNGSVETLSDRAGSDEYYRHYRLSEGTTVIMYLRNYRSVTADTSITVQKGVKATGIAYTQSVYEGQEGTYIHAYLEILPKDAYTTEYINTVTADETVAMRMGGTATIQSLYLGKEGVTTLTATCGELVATTTIKVNGNPKLALDVPYMTTLEDGQGVNLDFTAPETGIYMFFTPRYMVPGFGEVTAMIQPMLNTPGVTDVDARHVDSGYCRYYRMEAGSQITLRLYNCYAATFSPSLTVSKAVAPTSLRFEGYEPGMPGKATVGSLYYLSVISGPDTAYGDITFSVSDDSRAIVVNSGRNWCDVRFTGAGTVTVTASCGEVSCSQTFTVSEPLNLTVDTPVSFTVDNDAEVLYFTFPESGAYVFQTLGSHGDFNMESYGLKVGENYRWLGNDWPEHNRELQYISADAGSVLELRVHGYSSCDITVSAFKAKPVTELYFNQETITGTVGDISHIHPVVGPEGAWGELTWNITDPTVAQIVDQSGGYVAVNFLQAGATTLTVSCGELSATVQLVGQMPVYLKLHEQNAISLPADNGRYVFFTAPETGKYAFFSRYVELEDYGSIYADISFEGGNGMWTEIDSRYSDEGMIRFAYIEEGTMLRIRLQNHSTYDFTGNVLVTEVTAPTQLITDVTEIRGIPGSYEGVSVEFKPITAMGEFTCQIADPTIAEIDYRSSSYVSVYMKALGSTTMTITCGELSVTVDITVEEPRALQLNEKVELEQHEGVAYFSFTAPEDGIYGFETNEFFFTPEEGRVHSGFCSVEFMELPEGASYGSRYAYGGVQFTYVELKAGQRIELGLRNYTGFAADVYIRVIKAAAPTRVFFDGESTIMQPGDWCSIYACFDPVGAYAPLEFSVSGEGELENYVYGNEIEIGAVKTGTWIITVTCGKLSDTITVNVVAGGIDIPDYGDPEEPGFAEVVGSDWGDAFETLSEAIAVANAEGGYVRLNGELHEDITITEDTWLDLNGGVLYGDVTIEEGATLYAFDTATADYDAEDMGGIIGSVTGNLARSLNTPKDLYGHNYKYMAVEWMPGAWTFHRYYLTVKSVILAPCVEEEDGIATEVNYRTIFKTNPQVLDYITAHGAKFEGEQTVYANYFTGGIQLMGGVENDHTVGLGGTMKSGNTAAENLANSLLAPKVSAYIELSDGTILESACVTRSLQEMAEYANDLEGLSKTKKSALGKMYDVFKSVMDKWSVDIENIKAYAAEYWNTDLTPPFAIVSQPKNITVSAGTGVQFTVGATGKGLTYQWRAKAPDGSWTNATVTGMSGYKTTALTIVDSTGMNGYQFMCIVRDADGNRLDTQRVTLTVQ